MEQPIAQNLKYGVIYVFYNPVRNEKVRTGRSLIEKTAYPFIIQWSEDLEMDTGDTMLVARRFNVGNIGQSATVTLRLSDSNPHGVQFDALHKFRDKLFDVSGTDYGNIFIDEDSFVPDYMSCTDDLLTCSDADLPMPMAAPEDHTRVELQKKKRRKNIFGGLVSETNACRNLIKEYSEPDLLDDEQQEIKRIERERRQELEQIRRAIINYIAQYHEDPQELMAELMRGKVVVGKPGRLLVNGNLKIVLPELDEMEIKMPAMCRTLYILFMKYSKQGGGIVLKNIDEYRDEILDIYGLVKPGANESRVRTTVDNLCDPLSDSLNQMISRINRCVKNVITDKASAKHYIIAGTKGGAYGIDLNAAHMELPRAVTGE